MKMGRGREIGCVRETADELWKGHTVEDRSAHSLTHRHTHRHTEVKTVYLPVSLRSLGGYNKS